MKSTAIRDAEIVANGTVARGTVIIRDGRIDDIVADGAPVPATDETVEAAGMMLLPGAIDDHVHFRDPGFPQKGTMATESAAAVRGGVTTVMDMPNTSPQTTTLDLLKEKMEKAAQSMATNYSFYIGATNSNADEVLRADYTRVCGIKLFMGSSTGGMLVDDSSALRKIFSNAPALIAAHCEDEATIRREAERARATYGDAVPWSQHPHIRTAEACYASSAMAAQLARETGARLHIMHITTERELALLDRGTDRKITGEACPTHLWFSDEAYDRLGPLVKCNPAVKSAQDRDALRRAVADGIIATVGTDHAPHALAEKLGANAQAMADRALAAGRYDMDGIGTDYWHAPSGMPMIEHSLPMMLTLADQGWWDYPTVAARMAEDVADLYQIEGRGRIAQGYWADLALVARKPQRVERPGYHCGWTPMLGETLTHTVTRTYVSGELAYADGKTTGSRGMAMRFKR